MNNLFVMTCLVGVLFCVSCYASVVPASYCTECNCCAYEGDYGYLPDFNDSCIYYVCQRVAGPGGYTYTFTEMPCPLGTRWDQSLLTCVHGECEGPVVTVAPDDPCDTLEAVDGDNTVFRYKATGDVQPCAPGTLFNNETCICDHGYNPSTCVPELYFPYNEDFDSDSCSEKAVSVQVGTSSATLSWDAKSWKSAYFDGNDVLLVPFMDNYFANNNVQGFTVALWFKWTSPIQFLQGLVYQSACQGLPSFGIHVGPGPYLGAFLGTDAYGFVWPGPFYIQQWDWTHVAIVYDGSSFNVYVNGGDPTKMIGASMSSTPITGSIINSQCSMVVGQAGYQGTNLFVGFIDELHVYMEKALTQTEVQALMPI